MEQDASSITYDVIYISMSTDSTQNIPQEATRLKKLAKVTARYMEMEEFKDSDHHDLIHLLLVLSY